MTQQPQTQTSKPSRLKRIVLPIIIVVVGLLVMGVLSSMAPAPEKKPSDAKPPLVSVMDIKTDDVTFYVTSQGSVMPRTETLLISEVAGQVIYVSDKLRVGGYFSKGEILLEVDPIVYEVNVLQAQSRLESAQASFIEEQARAEQAKQEWQLTGKPLSKAPILALRKPQVQKAQADVKAAKADLKEAQTKLARTKIKAPYDALIAEKHVDIGQYVSTGSQLAKTYAIDYAEVRLPIKQADLQYLRLPKLNRPTEQISKVTLSAQQGQIAQQWSSFVARYEGVVSNESRVHYLVAQIDDPYNLNNQESDSEARMGMFVRASIEGKLARNVVILPQQVIHGADTVYVVEKDNTLSVVNVDILRAEGNRVYVKNTFTPKQRIITSNLRTAIPGMPVRIEGEKQTTNDDTLLAGE
ncbi:efflux RND transporter periplasmic adaptor subunit [Thalassotalea maritima]|uniref:efflux RND transporter periplasmic adaptor subunit n=1 Tax=Thalassotalea maritima TaxID=3242416 RepID=UPI003527DB73